jgi:hypothetical protein
MAISARVQPNSALKGLMKTLQAYNSKPHVVLPKIPPIRGMALGRVVSGPFIIPIASSFEVHM